MCGYLVVILVIGLQCRESTPQLWQYHNASGFWIEEFSPRRVSWERAIRICKTKGMQLLTIKSAEKGSHLGNKESWLALREYNNSVWKWNDGDPLGYSDWIGGNSDNNAHPDGVCAFRLHEGFWFDHTCSQSFKYLCEYSLDDRCRTVECRNGVCENLLAEESEPGSPFRCNCEAGYTDTFCDKDKNECDSTPCINGGICLNRFARFICHCPRGFLGVICETDIDECASSPCQHSGNCTDGRGRFICACPNGTAGRQCETDIDECASDPCLNSASCVDRLNGYSCNCTAGFTGVHCEREICTPITCSGHGECTDTMDGVKCACSGSFTGTKCETEICTEDSCNGQGECSDTVDGIACACTGGFTGRICETQVCTVNTCNGLGECSETADGVDCQCTGGFTGEVCETNIDECDEVDCSGNGRCTDMVNNYKCECTDGFTGQNCESASLSVQVEVDNPVVATGSRLELFCSSNYGEGVAYVWIFAQESSQSVLLTRNQTFVEIDVKELDSGEYTCRGLHETAGEDMDSVTIQVLPPDEIQNAPQAQATVLGTTPIVGISIAAFVVFVIVIAVLVTIAWRRRRRQTSEEETLDIIDERVEGTLSRVEI